MLTKSGVFFLQFICLSEITKRGITERQIEQTNKKKAGREHS